MSKHKTQKTTEFLMDSVKMFFGSILFTASLFTTGKETEVEQKEAIKQH